MATGRVIRKFRGHDSEVCLFVLSLCLNYLDWIAFEIKGFMQNGCLDVTILGTLWL